MKKLRAAHKLLTAEQNINALKGTLGSDTAQNTLQALGNDSGRLLYAAMVVKFGALRAGLGSLRAVPPNASHRPAEAEPILRGSFHF